MEHIKELIVGGLISVCAYLSPIQGEVKSLLLLFMLNFFFGYLAGMLANREKFSLKKAFNCIKEATIFFLLVCALYYIGEQKGNESGALQCISFITYAIVYFYSLNILKNCKLILHDNTTAYKAVSFLYYVVSVEFIKHVPGLSAYIKTEGELQGTASQNTTGTE